MGSPEEELKAYIVQRFLGRRNIQIDEDTQLVSSGLVDSMGLVDLLSKLEDLTDLRIPAGKVQPRDMDTIRMMLATAQRVGKPHRP